jgi:hypothetical protein
MARVIVQLEVAPVDIRVGACSDIAISGLLWGPRTFWDTCWVNEGRVEASHTTVSVSCPEFGRHSTLAVLIWLVSSVFVQRACRTRRLQSGIGRHLVHQTSMDVHCIKHQFSHKALDLSWLT